jgi:hypothetical protein
LVSNVHLRRRSTDARGYAVRISAPAALRTIVPGSRISTTVTLTDSVFLTVVAL